MYKALLRVMLTAVFLLSAIQITLAQENPWTKYKEGSWVLYELTPGMQQKQTLISKSDKEYVLETTIIMNGKVISTTPVTIPLQTSQQPVAGASAADVKVSDDNIEFKGQAFACKVYETTTPQGVGKTWITENIPGGIIQTTLNNNIFMRAVDYEAK